MGRITGYNFPAKRKAGGYFTALTDATQVKADLLMLLTTRPNERVMLPEFGSRLPDLVFEPNDTVLEALAELYIIEAIKRWEPRVRVLSTAIRSEEHELHVTVQFAIKENLNETQTLAFQLLREGVNS